MTYSLSVLHLTFKIENWSQLEEHSGPGYVKF